MTQNLIDLNLNKTNPKTLRTWLCHVSTDKELTVKLKFSTPQEQKNFDCFKVDGFCAHCKTVFEAMACEWWNLYKTTTCVKEHLKVSFPYKRPLWEGSLLEQIRSGKLFGYVQCDIEVPEELKKKFANFPPIFKNTNVGRHDIGSLMQDYAEKEGLLCQPRKILISSFFLENDTLITPLLLFYLALGLVCKKFFASLDTLQLFVSVILCNLLSMLVEKETRMQTQVLSRKQ